MAAHAVEFPSPFYFCSLLCGIFLASDNKAPLSAGRRTDLIIPYVIRSTICVMRRTQGGLDAQVIRTPSSRHD